MSCFYRSKPIQLPVDEKDDHLDAVYALSEKESLSAAVVPSGPDEDEMQQRLHDLRVKIHEAKLDWYEDEHQSEDVADSEKRREWISKYVSFNGSAGTALIPSSAVDDAKALLFTDSRYWILAEKSIPKENWEVRRVGAQGTSGRNDVTGGWVEFVADELDGCRIGIDPKLITDESATGILHRLSKSTSSLVAVKDNLIDAIHTPLPRSLGQLEHYPRPLSGEETKAKIERMRKVLGTRAGSDKWIYLIPTLPTIAWLLNYRCPTDIPFCPVAFAYAALTPDSCVIFVDNRKVKDDDLREDWKAAEVSFWDYGIDSIKAFVKQTVESFREDNAKSKFKVLASRESSWALVENHVELISCPVDEAKALKNEVELQNFRNAYLRDGRAMVRWMSFLEQKIIKEGKAVGEWAAGMVLMRFRRDEDMFKGPAYPDISATGPNAASPHYEPTRGNEAVIDIETPYVIDSGPQYLDATIDTTRTLFMGKSPTDDMKRAYTRVLQGHIAVAAATFPQGTDAYALGTYSKKFLWDDGLDYGHGLGHGVGNYGAVHESPVGFRPGFKFKHGHVTTIEPGFYLEGQWGMRIENVYICRPVDTDYEFGGHRYLGFELVTRVPIDTRLIDWTLTTKSDIRWVNAHNKTVQDELLPLLDDDLDHDAKEWLKRMCKEKHIFPWTGA